MVGSEHHREDLLLHDEYPSRKFSVTTKEDHCSSDDCRKTETEVCLDAEKGKQQHSGIKLKVDAPLHLDTYREETNACFTADEYASTASKRKQTYSGDTSRNANAVKRLSSIRENPFAERKGRRLAWTGVNMTVGEKDKKILSEVWGEVPPKEITAIAGPSGAGKSSLLNILCGRVRTSRGSVGSRRASITVNADIRLDGYEVRPTSLKVRKQMAFVPQDDSLHIGATPRECIRFSAKLRLPRSTTENELDRLVERMLAELGLTSCADTIVGGAIVKGISGGERKRTSVGIELVVKPAVVLLDEPTSGLDSFSAVQLLRVLKKVANAGSSVLFTIHQPSSEVFAEFDNFILLRKGRVMYQGSVEDVPDYFAARGHETPPRYNPADFIMNVAQLYSEVDLENMGFFPKDMRNLPPAEKRSSAILLRGGAGKVSVEKHQHAITQVRMLLRRDLLGMKRYTLPLVTRYAFSSIMALLIGMIFFEVGATDPSIPKNFQSHFGALTIVLMTNMFGTASPSLLQFPSERPVFLREYYTDHYSVVSYFVSRLATEALVTIVQVFLTSSITFNMIRLQMHYLIFVTICFSLAMTCTAMAVMLGCMVQQPKVAIEFLPLLFVPQFLLSGFFVDSDLIPPFIGWAQYLCSLTYALRLCLLYEFGHCEATTCQSLLRSNDVRPEKAWWYWFMMCLLFFIFKLTGVTFLRQKATQFR